MLLKAVLLFSEFLPGYATNLGRLCEIPFPLASQKMRRVWDESELSRIHTSAKMQDMRLLTSVTVKGV